MLQSLHIHHFALIEDMHITFSEGVTIFTGETGAGKSILMDAIGMLAGKRASAAFVRQGTEAFLVEGAFFFSEQDDRLRAMMQENHIEEDGMQLVISRQFHRNGRGTILVNGTIVPTGVLKKIGGHLLDIHGQFDNGLIFDAAHHVRILDGLTPALKQARYEYDQWYRKWCGLMKQIRELHHKESEKARMLSILDFQIKEIEGAKLREGEEEALERDIRKASHGEHIRNYLSDALFALEGSERQRGIQELIDNLQKDLSKAAAYDEVFQHMAAKAESLSYEIEDIHDCLITYADSFHFDEKALDAMQSRLAAIEKLCRKYGATVADVLAFLARAKEEYDQLEQSENRLLELKNECHICEEELRQQGKLLMEQRLLAAETFRSDMGNTLHQLGMPACAIAFHIEPMKDITPDGAASVELYFSANVGEDMRPLAKTASGGEVSRIALALKTVAGDRLPGKTMIFDEIDVGISGQTGLQVAEHIRRLCGSGQVFCITHLPQTASIADCHYFLFKTEEDGRTVTQIRRLSDEEHIREIARMFSGNDATSAGMEAARQLTRQMREKNK